MREPKIIYRYIAVEFGKTFAFSLIAITVVMLVSEFFDDIKTLLDYKASMLTVLKYFSYRFPLTALKTCPMATLLATLFTLNIMTKNNEITAMKTSGFNLLRIAAPILALSLFISVSVIVIHEMFAAELYYNSKLLKFNQILKSGYNDEVIRDNIAFKSLEDWTAYIKHFDGDQGIMNDVSLIYANRSGFIFKRIDAASARWDNSFWVFSACTIREFALSQTGEISENISKYKTLTVRIKDTPKDIARSRKNNEEYTLREMSEYISKQKASGAKYKDSLINYHFKISVAFANFIMALIGIPFGLGAGKYSGIIFSFVISLVFVLVYNNLLFIGQSLGVNGLLSPALAAWFGNLIFFGVGCGLIFRVRK
ncbi:MAG: LptF/LptG family permease [Candidatus Firestonebacteria bacterium]